MHLGGEAALGHRLQREGSKTGTGLKEKEQARTEDQSERLRKGGHAKGGNDIIAQSGS